MKTFKKEMSILLVLALVFASLVFDFGQLDASAYDNYAGTGVFRVDIVIGANDCSNGTRGTDSKFQLKLLDAGDSVIAQTPADALNGASGAGDGGTNPLENNATTSFTFNGADFGDVNETVAALGALSVNKTIAKIQLVCTTAADDWIFNNVIVYYSPDGGSAWTTLANNSWQASSGTATWSAGNYFTNNYKTLGFNPNGGIGGGTYDAIPGQTIDVPAAPVKTGYTFIGWLGAPARMPGSPTTYFAGWSANSYTITFDSSGGSAVTPITNNYGTTVTPPANPVKTGYTFTGWQPEVPVTMPAGNTTCTALWSINIYTVTFDSNGGSAIEPVTQEYATEITAPDYPERTGYTFTGWIPAVPAAMPAANTTCVAQWSVNSYTITFDSNGGTAVAPITQSYGTAVSAPANLSREGFTLTGWQPPVPAAMPAENITCTAQWQINSYTVTFNANGGSAVSAITQDYETLITAPDNPSRAGYTFAGWLPAVPAVMPAGSTACVAQWNVNSYTIAFDSAGGSAAAPITQNYGTAVTAPDDPVKEGYTFTGWLPLIPDAMPAGDLTCVAQWAINSYTILFDTAGGSAVPPITQNYGTALTVPAGPVKTGYIFTGWQPAFPAAMPAGGLTCTAQWAVNSYTIMFNANGGEATQPVTQEFATAVIAPANPVRLGYTFTGWQPAVPVTMPAEDITCTAQWRVNSYTVTFDSAGGSAVAPITQDFGTALVPPASPVKTGYTFTGWQPALPTTVPAEDITCTAQWLPNNYTIIFDPNGGTGGGEVLLPYGSIPAAPDVTREGYTFDGWLPEVGTVTGNATYTAQWISNTVTIFFDANGGTGGGEQTVNYGQMPVVPVVTRTNYRFAGWSPEVVAAAEDTAYTAQWIKLGDLNTSGTVTSVDALLVLQYAAGLTQLIGLQLLQADVDMNGVVNSIDALKILQFASGLITSF